MYVHVDPQVFERRPLIMVFLAGAALYLALFGTWVLLEQYRRYGPAPEPISVDDAVPPPDYFDVGPWVTLHGNLKLKCGRIIQRQHGFPESLLFGRIESSYLPATNVTGDRFFLIQFDRDFNCGSLPKGPFSGVLTGVNSQLQSTLRGDGLDFPPTKVPPMLLAVDWSPDRTRKYLLLVTLFQILPIWAIRRFWMKHLALRRKRQ